MGIQATTHTYTIKEASSLTGLPSSTLRYYESIGIIEPIERDASSKQRVYSEEDLGVLDSIACLNATGMSIHDMKTYISNRNRGAEGANEQIQLLAAQKRHLAAEAKMLEVRQQYVDLKIAYWQAVEEDDTEKVQAIGSQARKLADILKHPVEQ
jgi:DNA-binding transcriptional MerR regulator